MKSEEGIWSVGNFTYKINDEAAIGESSRRRSIEVTLPIRQAQAKPLGGDEFPGIGI